MHSMQGVTKAIQRMCSGTKCSQVGSRLNTCTHSAVDLKQQAEWGLSQTSCCFGGAVMLLPVPHMLGADQLLYPILYIKETVWGSGWSTGGLFSGRAPDRGDAVFYSWGP